MKIEYKYSHLKSLFRIGFLCPLMFYCICLLGQDIHTVAYTLRADMGDLLRGLSTHLSDSLLNAAIQQADKISANGSTTFMNEMSRIYSDTV